MNGIMLVVLLIGAAAAVLLIRFVIRASSRRSPAQIRIDPDKSSVSQQAASPELILEPPQRVDFPRDPVPPQPQAAPQIHRAPPTVSSEPAPSELHIDKNVQFTVYRPSTIVPNHWYPLVAFAHLSNAGPTPQRKNSIRLKKSGGKPHAYSAINPRNTRQLNSIADLPCLSVECSRLYL